jgi:hypothetical protein
MAMAGWTPMINVDDAGAGGYVSQGGAANGFSQA